MTITVMPCRNPLESGQCFLRSRVLALETQLEGRPGRNPLESGQCFLHKDILLVQVGSGLNSYVAIPSNRVNVSY